MGLHEPHARAGRSVCGDRAIAVTAREFVLHGGAISSALLEGQQLQAVEFVTSPTASIADKKISEAGLPKEAIAGAIVRNDSVIIPPDDSIVKAGDHVIIVSPISAVPAVEKLFK